MNQTIIRKGRKADLPFVYQLVKSLAEFEKEPDAVTASLQDYYIDYKSQYFDFLVATKENEIIGIALYYKSYSTWKGRMLYLEDFVIDSKYRRQGIGSLLFDAFLEAARQEKCVMTKWQVLDWNSSAVKFYEKKGAKIEKCWWNGKLSM